MADYLRLRKDLTAPSVSVPPAEAVSIVPLWQSRPIALHALLQAAYANGGGTVASFDEWWWQLVEDEEFDPELIILAYDGDEPIGLAQCWNSSFIKDLVVSPAWRNRGIGSFLLVSAFARLQQRGFAHADLKVETGNIAAQRFYMRHGMTILIP
ncbi:GNAT family N-acetyltransferase [Devosia soli]|uniref:GNAT family N-acetyltransferase n=1 Tax=Devosia soli TaxID=361041 RepID=UPI000AEBAE94|nr:GNAT family N-acetyltransferase [Devosia soli]